MKKKRWRKEKSDRTWIWDVAEFFLGIAEIVLYIPRIIIRVVREL